MLSKHRSRVAIGCLFLVVGLLCVALTAGREAVQRLQPRVEVDVSNVDGTVQVAIECEQAAEVVTGEARVLDLGRMSPDTRIFASVLSSNQHPAWEIGVRSNGSSFFEDRRGHAKTPLAPLAEADAIVLAKAFTAGGDDLGSIGCQDVAVISKSDVPRYVQSPDEKGTAVVGEEKSPFQPRHFPYDEIDTVGRWSLVPLAVLGVLLTIAIGPTRRLLRSHWQLASGALAFLATIAGLFVGVLGTNALIMTLTVSGTLLLFAVALLLVRPRLWERLEGAAGAGGAQGEEEDHAAADGHDAHLAADDGEG